MRAVAAVLALGIVTAYWIATQKPAPDPQPENKFVVEDKLIDASVRSQLDAMKQQLMAAAPR